MKRRQLFVDNKVQGALVMRCITYWFLCLMTVTLMLLCWRVLTGPARMFYRHLDDMWFHFGPALVASLILLPIVVIDIIRLSNRFAGPMVRMRRAMQNLAKGERVPPLQFRDNDFWKDFAQDFNTLLARVERELPPPRKATETPAAAREMPVGAGLD